MNNKLKFLAIGTAAFVIGLSVNNFALSDVGYNVAVVDVGKVIASSSQVEALKKEQQAKSKELMDFVEKARKDVAAQKDDKKKQDLEQKYNNELRTKKEAIDKGYTAKLSAIDDSISKQIENTAKAGHYDLILVKGAVLHGGTDITDTIIKAVK
jgi:Skp family chaperone for outer membrane proteins